LAGKKEVKRAETTTDEKALILPSGGEIGLGPTHQSKPIDGV
jgi:hypothetical protein